MKNEISERCIKCRIQKVKEEIRSIKRSMGLSEGDLLLAMNRAKVFSTKKKKWDG